MIAAIDTPAIDWAALSPYLVLLAGIAVVMLASVFARGPARNALGAVIATLALVGAGVAAIVQFTNDATGEGLIADSLRSDRLADLTQVILVAAGLLAVLVAFREPVGEERCGEVYALLLSAVGGMAFLVASNDLITLFLGLEWFSISLYILCAITLERTESLEAGLKYLVAGSFGSAILLFGCALVYGATGEIGYAEIAAAAPASDDFLLVSGLAMLLVGLAFKASAAPFHQWTPDVYEGSPTPITAFMAAATKVAALVLTLRFLTVTFPSEAELWTIALGVIAAISLAWGNLGALVQRNVKRMLAYSSISHAGFLLMPIAAGNELGGRALLFYLIPYAALSVGAFAVVAARERELGGRKVTFENMAGFGWERPLVRRGDGHVHDRLRRAAADRHLRRQVLRLLGALRAGLDLADGARGGLHRRLHLLLPRPRPRDVHARGGGSRARRRPAARRPATRRSKVAIVARARRRRRHLLRGRAADRRHREGGRLPPLPVLARGRARRRPRRRLDGRGVCRRAQAPRRARSDHARRARARSAASAPTTRACPRRRCSARPRRSLRPEPCRAPPRP